MSVIYLNSLGGGETLPIKTLFDFNFKDSLIDRIHGFEATLKNGATRDNNGVYLSGITQYIDLKNVPLCLSNRKTTYEIKIGDCAIQNASTNNRFFMWTKERGLVYRGAQSSWQVYNGSSWYQGSGSSDPNVFKNKTCKLVFTDTNNLKVYSDDTLVFSNSYISMQNNVYVNEFRLGGDATSFYNIYIERFKAYIE